MRGTGFYVIIAVLIMILLVMMVRGCMDAVYSCNTAMETAQREREQEQRRSENYAKAIELLQSGDYLEARKLLDYLWDYKDGEVLLTYARARISFQNTNYFAYSTYDYLNQIPTDYSGDLAEDIAAFRIEAEKRRPELQALYDAEQEKWAETERQLAEQRAEWRERMKADAATHKKPYVGMDSEFISYTQLGRYDMSDLKDGVWFYYWTKNGMTFFASVQDGKVVHTGGSTRKKYGGSAGSSKSSDPYNASDYAHVDDFYYDHRDDFWDFEEAEDLLRKPSLSPKSGRFSGLNPRSESGIRRRTIQNHFYQEAQHEYL